MNLLDVGFVIAGLVLLGFGGEALVRGAGTIATKARVSPLIIGLVVVSAATSAPEFAVTIGAVSNGEPDLAIGNVIGSNIANILLILGVAALISPLVIKRQLVRFDIPVMLGISVLLVLFSLDGRISPLDGGILFALLAMHVAISVVMARRSPEEPKFETVDLPLKSAPVAISVALGLVVLGVGMLVVGSQVLVTGAINIATALGVSSLVIGLTVVAIGTSLPELATSIAAIRKGETDMAVGNVVGSNIFNIGLVLGVPAFIFGDGLPVLQTAIAIDFPIMLAAAVALLPIAFTGFIIARWEGALFFGLYLAYMIYLVLDNTDHEGSEAFSFAMLYVAGPLLALTLIGVVLREVLLSKKQRGLEDSSSQN